MPCAVRTSPAVRVDLGVRLLSLAGNGWRRGTTSWEGLGLGEEAEGFSFLFGFGWTGKMPEFVCMVSEKRREAMWGFIRMGKFELVDLGEMLTLLHSRQLT